MPKRYLLIFPPALLVLLLIGVLAGLRRSGVGVPVSAIDIPLHGPLMIAFFTAVISLERAVAYARLSALLVPLSAAISGVLLLFGRQEMAMGFLLLAALGQPVLYLRFWKMSREMHIALQGIAPLFLAIGTIEWWRSGWIATAINGWLLYLVWTIAGERLDLQRLARPSLQVRRVLLLLFVFSFIALAAGSVYLQAGTVLVAIVLAALALWLLRYDIARRTVKLPGQTRYIALALLSGYGWLLVGAVLRAWHPGATVGPFYDAALHSIWLGFVFSMVFGHLPVILPALSGTRFLWHPALYVPLALLHLSLALRVTGDLMGSVAARQWGSIWGAISIALFIAVALTRVRLHQRFATPPPRIQPTKQ